MNALRLVGGTPSGVHRPREPSFSVSVEPEPSSVGDMPLKDSSERKELVQMGGPEFSPQNPGK